LRRGRVQALAPGHRAPRGPVFLTFDLYRRLTSNRLDPSDVARILRWRAAGGGVTGDFAGHSLRRGFITNAEKKKIPIESIKRVTGQRSSGIVLDYVAAATLEDGPPLFEIVGQALLSRSAGKRLLKRPENA
jgi:hypothetical protein